MIDINKLFLIKCPRCAWSKFTSGLKQDLTGLFEIKKCVTCGGPRKFRCQRCGQIATMKRLSGNNKVGTDASSTNSPETTS
jgi:hypothetical protein